MPTFYINKDLAKQVRRIAKRDRQFAPEYLFDMLQYAPMGASPVLCDMIVDELVALTDDDLYRGKHTYVVVKVKNESMD